MSVSSPKGKKEILEWFRDREDIKTIVDLGPGSGTYPKLLGKEKYTWKAVEIWGPYVEMFGLNDLYEEIRIGDIRYMDIPEGDCVIFGDVVEHMEKDDAIKTFLKIEKLFPHAVLSIPINSHTQYVHEGNVFEKHLSVWTEEEIEKMVPSTYKIRNFIHRPPNRPRDEGHVLAIFIK